MYKRVLLKLSGEALSNGKGEIFSNENLDEYAGQIKELIEKGVEVGIVLGGGNIYRGKMGVDMGMDRTKGDYMGMMATVMNGLAMSNSLNKMGVKTLLLSSFEIKDVADQFNQQKAERAFKNSKAVIFVGGTGHPYFSTDTCSALRALETKCEVILAAKNGVDGVYSADPKKDKNAVRYDEITYLEILEKNLQVMDLTAISLCKENNMPLVVFNMNKKGNIVRAAMQENIGTIVHN